MFGSCARLRFGVTAMWIMKIALSSCLICLLGLDPCSPFHQMSQAKQAEVMVSPLDPRCYASLACMFGVRCSCLTVHVAVALPPSNITQATSSSVSACNSIMYELALHKSSTLGAICFRTDLFLKNTAKLGRWTDLFSKNCDVSQELMRQHVFQDAGMVLNKGVRNFDCSYLLVSPIHAAPRP